MCSQLGCRDRKEKGKSMTSSQMKKNKERKEKIIEKILKQAGYLRNENMYQDYKDGIVSTVYYTHKTIKRKLISFDYVRTIVAFEKNVSKGEIQYIYNSILNELKWEEIVNA